MAITNGYTTLAILKTELGIGDTSKDSRLERVIEAASREIDRYCRRRFYQSASGTERTFTASDARLLAIDDATAVTAVVADHDGDGTFEEAWTASDYVLEPFNAAGVSEPFTRIQTTKAGSFRFPVGTPKGVKITGTWGWPAIPDEVEEACIKQSARLFQRHAAVFGVAPVPAFEGQGGIRLLARLDPDVEALLVGLRRALVAVA